jgi:hypothetical protein
LVTSSGKQFDYQLLGFDYDGIIVRKAGSTGYTKKTFLLLKGTELIDCEGNKIGIAGLERLVTIGEIPILSVLKLLTASGEINIDMGEIEMIQIPGKKNGKIAGLIIGAAADVAALIVISSALQDFSNDLEKGMSEALSKTLSGYSNGNE